MKLRYGRLLSDKLDGEHGLTRSQLRELGQRFSAVHAEVERQRAAGEFGFERLQRQADVVRGIRKFADGLGQAYDHVLVLGVGGASLGVRALAGALRRPAWNELPDAGRDYFPRLTVLDTLDPGTLAGALGRIDPRRALVNVISKSGTTTDTLAQYLAIRGWLDHAIGPDAATRHLVFTTDPVRGPLREIAERERIAALDFPPDVVGRFSALTAAGLLPAALVGIDIEALLAGAARAARGAERTDLLRNPPALFAALLWAADAWLGARVHVVMPCDDRLAAFGAWFVQLWAESLGKRIDRRGKPLFVGPTPVAATGASARHGQLQLFMEGPFDKVVTFVRVEDCGDDQNIPHRPGLPEPLAWLPGHTVGELLLAEQEAISTALARTGRMNATLALPRLDASTFGELLMFMQLAAGYAGVWYGVNPFDQPGVDLPRRLACAALGRPGYRKEGSVTSNSAVPVDAAE